MVRQPWMEGQISCSVSVNGLRASRFFYCGGSGCANFSAQQYFVAIATIERSINSTSCITYLSLSDNPGPSAFGEPCWPTIPCRRASLRARITAAKQISGWCHSCRGEHWRTRTKPLRSTRETHQG
jgi:hypothetical protein